MPAMGHRTFLPPTLTSHLHPPFPPTSPEGGRKERFGRQTHAIQKALVEDVGAIDADRVPLLCYVGKDSAAAAAAATPSKDRREDRKSFHSDSSKGCSKVEQERRTSIPWTDEEHRLFPLGLDKFGKGDWRSTSRNFVISRTPTQVASHAQKYFIRRSSIHDITSINNAAQAAVPQPLQHDPITGQAPVALLGPPGGIMKHHSGMVDMYGGAPMGHPVADHMVPATVGTPVVFPPGPGHPALCHARQLQLCISDHAMLAWPLLKHFFLD